MYRAAILIILFPSFLSTKCNYYIEKKPSKEEEKPAQEPDEKSSDTEQATTFPTYSDIEPILRKNCVRCHGDPEINADFNMTTYKLLIESGYVELGSPNESIMYQAIKNEEMPLPPSKPLSKKEQKLIYDWIEASCPI